MDFASFTPEYLQRAERLKWQVPTGGIGAWVAEMDYGVAPAIAEVLRGMVDAGSLAYNTPRQTAALREATLSFCADRYDWQVAEDELFIVSDVIGALLLTLRHTLPAGTPVVVPTPAYMPFLSVTTEFGYPAVLVPGIDADGEYQLDLDAIDSALAAGARAVVLTNPHNPVGRVYRHEELLALSEVVERHGAQVFSDEIHAPLVIAEGATHIPYATVSEAAAAHTVTATAASKGWNIPGLKCAQLIVTSEAARTELRGPIQAYYGSSAATPGIVASAVAYRDSRDWIDEVRAQLRSNSILLGELVAEHLPGVRYNVPQGTYLGWLDFRETGLESPAEFFLKNANVRCNEGITCGASGFLRFNFAMAEATLRDAVGRMGEALANR